MKILDTALKLLKKCDNNAVRGPWISVILNYTITTYKYSKICSEQLCDTVYDAIVACYDLDLDAGNMHKVAISLGTMIFKEKDILSKIKAEKIRNDLTKGNFPRGESDDVSKVMREVDDMLNNVT